MTHHIPARVSMDDAMRFFKRRRPANLYGLIPHKGPIATSRGKGLPLIERIWLSYYLVDLELRSLGKLGRATVSVEGFSGAFAVFQMHDDMVDGPPPDSEYFPPKIARKEAVRTARQELVRAILRRRGQQDKPFIENTLAVNLLYYPYWVYYFKKAGKLSIRVQDALTAEKAGNRTRAGILQAFANAQP